MAIGSNPRVVTGNIVLWYDMYDDASYRGEPTNNLIKSQNGGQIYTNYNASGGIGMQPAPPGPIDHSGTVSTVKFNNTGGGSGRYGCCPNHYSYGNISSLSGNTVYTISYYFRENSNTCRGGNYIYHYEYGPSGYLTEYGLYDGSRVIDYQNGWKRLWGSFTSNPAMTNTQLYSFNYCYDTPIEIQMVGYQFEQKSWPTKYVYETNGIRTNTAALIDLSPTKTTITLDSMTYAANNGISFNGSSNYLTIPDPNVPAYNWTIELVFRLQNVSSGPILVCPQSAGIDQFIRVESTGSLVFKLAVASDTGERSLATGASTIANNTWYHAVFTRTQNTTVIFLNGVKYTQSDTQTNERWANTWYVGQRGNSTFWVQGDIPVFRLYNRDLTDEESKTNWEAMRGRFGL